MNNHLLSNFISTLKNGFKIKKSFIIIKRSNLILNILHILYKEGYIKGYKYLGLYNIQIFLKYYKDKSVINNIKLISKPSKRIFFNSKNILKNYKLNNLILINSSKGIITNKDLFKNYLNIYNNINFNLLNLQYNYLNYSLENLYYNKKYNLNFLINDLNLFNIFNRLYFYNNNTSNKYINLENIYLNYVKFNFFNFYNKLNNYYSNWLLYKKIFKIYFAYYILKEKNYLRINFFKILKKLNNILFIYKLNYLNFLLNINNLNNLKLKLINKKINLKFNYKKDLKKKNNQGGEILLLIN